MKMLPCLDNDGDTALVLFDRTIIRVMDKRRFIPVMDMYFTEKKDGSILWDGIQFNTGCPWSGDMLNAPESTLSSIQQEYTVSVDEVSGEESKVFSYTVSFKSADYNAELVEEIYRLGRHFMARKLVPNEIGLYTDYATKFADGVRMLGYALVHGVYKEDLEKHHKGVKVRTLDPETRVYYRKTIEKFEYVIEVLRLIQGWEIDKAKHGGAYAAFLETIINFVKKTPHELISDPIFDKLGQPAVDKESGRPKRKYYTPDWMDAKRGKIMALRHDAQLKADEMGRRNRYFYNPAPRFTGSVLSQLYWRVNDWFSNHMAKPLEERRLEVDTHNAMSYLVSGIRLTEQRYAEIYTLLSPIREHYIDEMKGLIEKQDAECRQIEAQMITLQLPYSDIAGQIKDIEDQYDVRKKELMEMVRDRVAQEVYAHHSLEEVGFVAYHMTYKNRKLNFNKEGQRVKGSSTAFPWVICDDAFKQTLKVATGQETQTNHYDLVAPKGFRFSLLETAFDQEVVDYINNNGWLKVVVEPDHDGVHRHFVYIHKDGQAEPVGVVFDDHILGFIGMKEMVFRANATHKPGAKGMDVMINHVGRMN